MPFVSRWLIEGTLTTQSPLHIGDGDFRPLRLDPDSGTDVRVSTVATTVEGGHSVPYLPGSTLKGNLRSSVRDSPVAAGLFGTLKNGGAAEFHDAFFDAILAEPQGRHWDPLRCVCIAVSTAIDRKRRTVEPKKLFYYEFVPEQVRFKVRITINNSSPEGVRTLLAALQEFDTGRLSLGAGTASGWGRLAWNLAALRRMDAAAVRTWFQGWAPGTSPSTSPGYSALDSLPAAALDADAPALGSRQLALEVELAFDSHFLVNDPARTLGPQATTDHAPLRDSSGRLLLPASSVRGALRGQAERICRTLGGNPSDTVVETLKEVRALDPVAHVFGVSGWRAPLSVSDFIGPSADELPESKQEFIAIDRFTGGGEEGKKFDATAVYRPKLKGALGVDLTALSAVGDCGAEFGLLALLLRDLVEGDITFGFGSAKGYGSCTAELRLVRAPGWPELPENLRAVLNEDAYAQVIRGELNGTDAIRAIRQCIADLRSAIAQGRAA